MRFRSAVRLSVVAAFALLPASAQAAGVVRPSTVTAGAVVPSGGERVVSLQCPRLAVALNAAVTSKGARVRVVRSVPGRDAGGWAFRLSAERGSGGRGATMALRCVELKLARGFSGATLMVNTSRQSVSVPAGQFVAREVGCQPGWVATGYALAGGRGVVRFASVQPAAGGWNFLLENIGSSRARATVHARCLRRRVSARHGSDIARLRFAFARRRFADRVGPGAARVVSHRCRSGQFSVATGSSVDASDAIVLAESAPAGPRAGRWTFARASAGDRVATSLVCMSRASRFR
jgi:hypothetical protein